MLLPGEETTARSKMNFEWHSDAFYLIALFASAGTGCVVLKACFDPEP